MSAASFLRSAQPIPSFDAERLSPRLSLTSDILDFRRCERKYGLYKVRGFQPSSPTAEFVGTFAHRSLQQAWREVRARGTVPDATRMAEILETVRVQMVDEEKRKPHSWNAVVRAGLQVLRMHKTLALRGMYAEFNDCERTLRLAEGGFVVEGVIDAVFGRDGRAMLWDWKASNDPRRILVSPTASPRSRNYASRVLRDYSLQLRVYHELHARVLGTVPAECRIVFLGELDVGAVTVAGHEPHDLWRDARVAPLTPGEWAAFEESASSSTRPGLFYTVSSGAEEIRAAVSDFHETARDILACRAQDRWMAPTDDHLPDDQTCRDCDFADSCPALKRT